MFRIILVDDDKISSFLLEKMLEYLKMGNVFEKFLNGSEFLNWLDLQQDNDHSYLVFLDIMMPIMDGWEVMERLKRHRLCKRVSVIMVSSSLSPSDRKMAMENGMVLEYLTKPVRLNELERLRTFLG
ncbi:MULTISPECIES: response regulator [Sphingobacterium]|uniref:response regulator n=1 Tax=Sphingobacterium TaxID=28453 RepID=UPI001625B40E|nr:MULTISPECIES: response regulator [Sphingobacterium]